jgi:hypothetical protein
MRLNYHSGKIRLNIVCSISTCQGLWLFFWLVVFSYYLELKEDAKLQQFSDRNMIDYDLVAFNDGVYRSHEGKMFSRV